MFWKSAKPMSITNRLLMIFICATLLILSIITALIYPPMRELLYHSHLNHEQYSYFLTQVCIKKLFVGLWLSALIVIAASYLLAKKSMRPILCFSKELASINASSLDKRLPDEGHPQELQQLAATCNAMLYRIENAFRHIKQFSASMAHELRNPLHYLRTATEITLAKPQSIEAYQDLLQTHLEEYQNLTKLIDNLLFLTRSEQRQLPLMKTALTANSLINAVVEYYLPTALDKGIEISLAGDASIEVDEQLFKRVIANLLDNSLAYTDEGGKINIKIENKSQRQVQITLSDNGIGIAKDHLPFLSQGFYRVDPQLQKENAGLGLGLAIAKSIMENHNGHLEIQSEPGLGTSVILSL